MSINYQKIFDDCTAALLRKITTHMTNNHYCQIQYYKNGIMAILKEKTSKETFKRFGLAHRDLINHITRKDYSLLKISFNKLLPKEFKINKNMIIELRK